MSSFLFLYFVAWFLSFALHLSNDAQFPVSLEVKDLGTAGSSVQVGTNEKSQTYFGAVGFVNDQVNLNMKVEFPHDTTDEKNKVSVRGKHFLILSVRFVLIF
jgi:hypothetical protein